MNLAETPRRRVPPYGSYKAKIAFIGEAPGRTEENMGEPFVGMSGKLLTQLMNIAGISRTSIFLHNTVPVRPKGNEISEFIKISSAGVSAIPEYYQYEQELYDILDKSEANVIVAVGATPLYALTRKIGILKWRGSILAHEYKCRMRKVIPIIHPAAALRTYEWQHYIIKDLKRVLEESSSPEISLPARVLHVAPSYSEIMSFLQEIEKEKVIGTDIEVMRRAVSCISIGADPYEVMSIPFVRGDMSDYMSLEQEVEVWTRISAILDNRDTLKMGQNIFFDTDFLFREYGIRAFPVADTMVAQAILYPEMPKGLDFITSWWTKEPYYKDEGKQYMKFGGSDDAFWRYNALDSAIVLEAYPKMHQVLTDINNIPTLERQTKLIEPLIYMNNRGIRVDVKEKEKKSIEAERKLASLQVELDALAGMPLNPRSSKQVMEYFYIRKGFKPYLSKGRPTADESALKRLSRKGSKEASIMLEMRHISTLKSRYFDMLLNREGRIQTSFNPVGTTTGRLSSSKNIFDEGGNMQNLHPEFQELLLADEGHVLYSMDLKQADMRVVAYIAPEFKMIEAFEHNRDVHSQTAALMFRKPISDISSKDGSSSIGSGQYSERFWGKKANHAFNYGMGYKKFALLTEIVETEGKMIHDAFHSAYPGLKQSYYSWVEDRLAKNRTLTTCSPFNRKRTFLGRWGYELFHEAYSFIPQSTVADVINEWGINTIYYDQETYGIVDLLNQIHDSLVFQISLEHSWTKHATVINHLKTSLEQTLRFEGRAFNIPVDLSMGIRMGKKNLIDIDLSSPVYLDMELEDAYNKIKERT